MFDATVLNVSNILHIDKWEISSNPTVPQVPTDSFWTTLTNLLACIAGGIVSARN